MHEGDEVWTYLLLYRHAHLVLASLTVHPEAKNPALKAQLEQAKREVSRNLRTLDVLKPKINQRCEKYAAMVRDRQERQSLARQNHFHPPDQEARPPSPPPTVQQLHGHEHSDLAVEVAHRERNRRAGRRREPSSSTRDAVDVTREVQRIQLLAQNKHAHESAEVATASDSATPYNYPNIRSHQDRQLPSPSLLDNPWPAPASAPHPHVSAIPPLRPAKVTQTSTASAPPRPEKVAAVPQYKEASVEPSYTFTSSAFLESGAPLRTLFLPPTLRTTFLRLAHKNTQANLETCAFLAGTLISNALFVSKLIVPAQTATSDTCEMTDESQLFDYVDSKEDLMILGWIHTHPSQTCFMSSRDLHTHAGYQMMLAESIAIVCAPSKGDTAHGGDWGVFRLTDPPGKMTILKCEKPGIFHPHDVDNVCVSALRPGHVAEAHGLDFEVVDLRPT